MGRRPGRLPRYAFAKQPTSATALPDARVYTVLMGDDSVADLTATFRRRLADVRARISSASAKAGRDPASVHLLPVSKTVSEDRLRAAYAAGCRVFGENKAQEAQRKWQAMSDLPDLRWSIIGHLQTNKAKVIAEFADEFQALDSLRVAEALDRRLHALGRRMDVLVQVNTSGEPSKFGLPPDEVEAFAKQLPAFSSLRVRGLMTLALHSDDAEQVRSCFVRLRELRDRLRQSAPNGIAMDELSMGMSGDFELAVEEGSTIVRVGQAIFGERASKSFASRLGATGHEAF
jgi:PLP dependent protein